MRSRKRALTLYYSSIGVREAVLLLRATMTAPFVSAARRRRALHAEVLKSGGAAAYSFNSARGALAAVLRSLGVGPDDEILLSSYTCLAVPTAVLAAGAKPTYCDIDPNTLNVTADAIGAAITDRTKVIVVQHTLGSVAPIADIMRIAKARGLPVIEDCALAVGSMTGGRRVGSFGDAAIYSLELSKTITTGWGGILVLNDPGLKPAMDREYAAAAEIPWRRAARMAVQTAISGVSYLDWAYPVGKYVVYHAFERGLFLYSTKRDEQLGRVDSQFIARMPGPQAALATHQWSRLDTITRRCAANVRRLQDGLAARGHDVRGTPAASDHAVAPRVSLVVDDRAAFMQRFEAAGISVGCWFDGPLSPLPEADVFRYDAARFPNAAAVARQVVNLPSHVRVTESDIDRMIRLMPTKTSDALRPAGSIADESCAGPPSPSQADR